MTKICKYCKCDNPNDFLVCKNCGKSLDKKTNDEIKIGKKTIIFIFAILIGIFLNLFSKVYDKNVYQTVSLSDKKSDIKVVDFKLPKKWVPIGKVIYNEKSIPNMYTFFVAAIDPYKNTDFQFFSTQFETDDGKEYEQKGINTQITNEEYIKGIIKKLSPHAVNIELISKEPINKKTLQNAYKNKLLFEWLYSDINPGTTKGRSWLSDFNIIPFKYIFSYTENGKEYNHLIEGRTTFFIQCFSNSLDKNVPANTAIKFKKCENIYSFKTEAKLFKKNFSKYKVFRKNLKINPNWETITNQERNNKLSEASYITTNSIVGGDKFNKELFKNTIYYIEYLDENSKAQINKNYDKNLKKMLKKMK